MNYKHFLLTRFNLGLYDKKQKTRTGNSIDPGEWMERRMELFKKYCAPSINSQTNKNFEWLIVLDKKTPGNQVDEVAKVSNGTILFGENFRQTSIDYIESSLTTESRILTSRTDNDDALHKDYIKFIQDWFAIRRRTGVVTFPKGWQYNIAKNQLHHTRYKKNPFLTLIEKRGPKPVKTILANRHTRVTDMFKLFKIETDSHMWTQFIHEENLANYGWGDKTDMNKFIPGDYGL